MMRLGNLERNLFCRVQHDFKKTTIGYQYLSNHGVLFGDCSRGN